MEKLLYEEQLRKIFSNVNDWLKFAEAKNFGLVSLNGIVILALLKITSADANVLSISARYVLFPFAIVSFLFALISLFPIMSKIEAGAYVKSWINKTSNWIDTEKKFENIHFYGYLKDIQEAEFEEKFLKKINIKKAFTEYERELVTQILYNSRISWLKYQLFKISAMAFLTDIVLFTIALPIILLIKVSIR
jgi:hypothetical protein